MNENYVSAIGWLSLVCSHVIARVSEGAFPWLGLQHAGAKCEGAVRPRRARATV